MQTRDTKRYQHFYKIAYFEKESLILQNLMSASYITSNARQDFQFISLIGLTSTVCHATIMLIKALFLHN